MVRTMILLRMSGGRLLCRRADGEKKDGVEERGR